MPWHITAFHPDYKMVDIPATSYAVLHRAHAIGKKAGKFFQKKNLPIVAQFSGIGDYAEFEEVQPIAQALMKYFLSNRYQKIYLFYTDFISTFLQIPRKIQVLPIDLEVLKEMLSHYALETEKQNSETDLDYILEPSPKEILENLTPQLVEFEIYHCILEANASEHSARMMAMRSASQNARDLTEKLILEYNKARQAQITSELGEISSAKEALE